MKTRKIKKWVLKCQNFYNMMQNDQSLSIDALSSNLPNSNNSPSDEMCSATRTHVLSTPITRVSAHVSVVVSNVRNVSSQQWPGVQGPKIWCKVRRPCHDHRACWHDKEDDWVMRERDCPVSVASRLYINPKDFLAIHQKQTSSPAKNINKQI